nr:MAG TPA: hypothetical protein [Caudoviricetes sp.]
MLHFSISLHFFYSNMECRMKGYLTPNLGWASVST